MDKENQEDITVNGPYSPVSLEKFLNKMDREGGLKTFNLITHGPGIGIAKDVPDSHIFYITPVTRIEQCDYYVNNIFKKNPKQIPAYLYRHLHYLFVEDRKYSSPVTYNTDRDVADAFISGKITETSGEYLKIQALILNSNYNQEAQQCIGFIQLFCGALSMAKKEGKGIRIYIETPEVSLHPAIQSKLMSLIIKIQDEYKDIKLDILDKDDNITHSFK